MEPMTTPTNNFQILDLINYGGGAYPIPWFYQSCQGWVHPLIMW